MRELIRIISITTLFLFLSISTYSQIDSTNQCITSKQDSSTIKSLDNEISTNSFEILLSYIIGGVITGIFTLGAVFITLKHQRKIAQAQIDVKTKQKFIDDLIEIINRIRLNLFEIFDVSHEVLKNIPQNMIPPEEDEIIREKIDSAMNNMYKKAKEFYFLSGSVFLYLQKSHQDYEIVKKLSNKLSILFILPE